MSQHDPIISIAAAARAEGVSRQTLHAQIKSGHVRRHPNGVRLSEVRADRRRNIDRTKRPISGPGSRKAAKRKAAASVNVYDDAGNVVGRTSVAGLIAEHGSEEALRQAADADGLVSVRLLYMSELLEDFARLTEEALADTESDEIDLRHLDVTASRADAEVLLAAYRAGTANLPAIRALHRRVGVRASD